MINGQTSFHTLSETPGAGGLMPQVLTLIHEAGNPYYDWFFGGGAGARAALTALLESPSSEVSATRATVLLIDGRLTGTYVALAGAELARCRLADALALVNRVSRDSRARESLQARIQEARALFGPIRDEDFFLSKIGVVPAHRGQGFGRVLLDHYLAIGSDAGFERFRLDVSADHARAIGLYRSAGFAVEARRSLAGMTYVEMVLGKAKQSSGSGREAVTDATG